MGGGLTWISLTNLASFKAAGAMGPRMESKGGGAVTQELSISACFVHCYVQLLLRMQSTDWVNDMVSRQANISGQTKNHFP